MSEVSAASISIPDLATALRAARTDSQLLTLNAATLGDAAASALLGVLNADALTLAAAQVSDIADGLTVTGRTALLSLAELDVTLTVTAPAGGLAIALRATAQTETVQLAGLAPVSLRQAVVTVNVMWTASARSLSGAISGNVRLGSVDVPVSISLPARPEGLRVSGSFGSADGPGLGALTSLIEGLDLVSSLPDGLDSLLRLQDFELIAGAQPFFSFTLASSQPLTIVPDMLSLESAQLFASVTSATADDPRRIELRIKAALKLGNHLLPIELTKDQASGDWVLDLVGRDVTLPGLADLTQLLGGAVALDALMPSPGDFGQLVLGGMQLRVNLARRVLSALRFTAAAQNEWTLPGFGGISFGRPELSLSIEGLGRPALAPDQDPDPRQPRPYFAFRLASVKSWTLIDDLASLERIELFIGMNLSVSGSPVSTRLEAELRLRDVSLPILLSNDATTHEWVLGLNSPVIQLPGLSALAELVGDEHQIKAMFPGLESFGELSLTGLELRIDAAQRKVSSFSFGIAAKDEWKLPIFGEPTLRGTSVALKIVNATPRAITGNISAILSAGGLMFRLAASKDAPGATWLLEGKTIGDQPLSLTQLASDVANAALPDGTPDLSFANLELSLSPSSGEFTLKGQSATAWSVPLGSSALALSNVVFKISRRASSPPSLEVSGDLAVGGSKAPVALKLPDGLKLSATLPSVKFSEALSALGADALLDGFGVPASFFARSIGASTLVIDTKEKTASLRGSIPDFFSAFEVQLRRDSRGKLGVAVALQPASIAKMQEALGVPGLGDIPLPELTFMMSSLTDSALQFETEAFKNLGPITRGFGFTAKIDLAALGLGQIPGLPTAPLRVQARFGSSPSQFTLAAALSEPGGRFVIQQSGRPDEGQIYLTDPELRISPPSGGGKLEVAIAGKLQTILDGQRLDFEGGVTVAPGNLAVYASMIGDWNRPFGLRNVVARDLSIAFELSPPLLSLGGTLQVGRTTGALIVKPSPTAPALKLHIDNLDLSELITNVCDPALANVPAAYRQTLADVRITNADLYIAPHDTKFGAFDCKAGVCVAGTLFAWGLEIDGKVQTSGSGPATSLQATGRVKLPNLGDLIKFEGIDEKGNVTAQPYFNLNLTPGQAPVVDMSAVLTVMQARSALIDIHLSDAGFKARFFSKLLGGSVGATLEISGGRIAPNAKYSIAAELDATAIEALLDDTKAKITTSIGQAKSELKRASDMLKEITDRGLELEQSIQDRRAAVQKERDDNAARLRDAEAQVIAQRTTVDTLLRELDSARATVRAERAEVERRIGAAQNDVNGARAAVNSLNNEINSTDRWFHSLPKIDVPWKASQAREGVWFGIKMGGLYVARDSALGVLDVASRTLGSVTAIQQSFAIDLDPRVAAVLGAHYSAQIALTATEQTIATLRSTISLLPVDMDWRVATLTGLREAQNVQRIAADAALKLAEKALDGIQNLTDSFVPSITVQRAFFSGELSVVSGGKVRLGIELKIGQQPRAFSIAYDLRDPLASAIELMNAILGKDVKKSIEAAQQSNTTAAQSIANAELEALPTDSLVNILANNGQLLRVVASPVLAYDDKLSLRDWNNHYLVAVESGDVATNRGTIGPWECFTVYRINAPASQSFVHYGDSIALLNAHGQFLMTSASNAMRSGGILNEWTTWTILHPTSPERRDEVDLSQGVAFRATTGRYMRSTGGGIVSDATVILRGETFVPINQTDWTGRIVASDSVPTFAGCQFRIKRSGDWIGFQSVLTGRYMYVNDYKECYADSMLFQDDRAWEHFKLHQRALYSEHLKTYLRVNNSPYLLPRVDATGTDLRNPASAFDLIRVQSLVSNLLAPGGEAAKREPTASDVSTSTLQKAALSGSAVAAEGQQAQRAAAEQALQLRSKGEDNVAALQQALLQAEADHHARRQRISEKAARGPRAALTDFRDSALRFDGQSYLEAPAKRAMTRFLSVAEVFAGLPAETLLTIKTKQNDQLLRVVGETPLRFGDTVKLGSSGNTRLLIAIDGGTWDGGALSDDATRFVISKADNHGSRDFVYYGDPIELQALDGRYVAARENNQVTANSVSSGSEERFTILAASDPNRRDAVDTTQKIALLTSRKTYVSATITGSFAGPSAAAKSISGPQSWTLLGVDHSAEKFSVLARGADPTDTACHFRLKRSGDWIGFESVRTGAMLRLDGVLRATGSDLADTSAQFRFENGSLRNQRGDYLRLYTDVNAAPLFDFGAQPAVASSLEFALVEGELIREATRVEPQPILALGSQFTIDAWIRAELLGGEPRTIVSKWTQSDDDELKLSVSETGLLTFAWHVTGAASRGAPGWTFCQSNEAVKLEGWSHVAAVRDGDQVSLYIDGRYVGGAQGLGTAPLHVGNASWRIGAQSVSGAPQGFAGLIDSVRIWGQAHSAASLRGVRYLVFRGSEDDLLACWNLDEDSGDTAFDAGRRELHARLVGNVQRVNPGAPEGPPLHDRHLQLSGGTANLGNVDLFGTSAELTLEAWVRVEQGIVDFGAILSKWTQTAQDSFMFSVSSAGKLMFAWHTEGATEYSTPAYSHVFSDGSVPLERWCHVAVVRQGKEIRFYRDGELIGSSDSANTQPLLVGTAALYLGSEANLRRFFMGSLAEVRAWNRALTEDELRALRQRLLVGDEPGLCGLWRCDEGWQDTLRDATSGSHHGTLSGARSWPVHGGPPRRNVPVRGMKFAGSQYLQFADDDVFSPSVALTIECWIKLDSLQEDITSIVSKWQQSNEDEYMLGLMANQKLLFAWHNQDTTSYSTPGWNHVLSEGIVPLGIWVHVAVVRAAKTVTFYIDGQPSGFFPVADDKPFRNGTANLCIGAEASGLRRFLRGTMAGLRIWRTARTQDALCETMSSLISSRAPGRILDLHFDEGEGTNVRDAASGRVGRCFGQPAFVSVTLPQRQPSVINTDPSDLWLQPVIAAAKDCQANGVAIAAAIPEVEASLALLERPSHERILGLLARAGYAANLLGPAAVQIWGTTAADVARSLWNSDRPAQEALTAVAAALEGGDLSQAQAFALVQAAGYLPEELGVALLDVWNLDARAVATRYREAGISTTEAARAVWAHLSRHAVPCFTKLVETLLLAGHAGSGVRKALQDHFGCDPSSIEHAALRANLPLTTVPTDLDV